MRLDTQRPGREAAVAGVAVFLVMAAVALLRIILGLERVEADKVAAVALGLVVAAEILDRKIVAVAAALMAIEAP